MPIIDFPIYVTPLGEAADPEHPDYNPDASWLPMQAKIYAYADVIGYEEVDGLNASDGEIRAVITALGELYNNINIDGTAYTGAEITSTSTVTAVNPTITAPLHATISIISAVGAGLEWGEGRIYLPHLNSFGSDRELIQGITYLPSLYSTADADLYIPEKLTEGYALLTGLASVGLIMQSQVGETYLTALVSQGWLYTANLDEEFHEPINAEAKITAHAELNPNVQVDGTYLSSLNAELSSVCTLYNNITIDGVTYTGASFVATGSVLGTATTAHPLTAAITATCTFNPSNDLGQTNPWIGVGGGFGYLPTLRSHAYTGERLEAQFNSWLFQFSANVGYGIYTHTFDNTLLFTDSFINLLAGAIYTETLANFSLDVSDAFSTYVTGTETFDSTLTATGLQSAHKFFINTFASALSSTTAFSALREQILSFSSSLTLADVFSALKQIIGDFLSSLTFDDAVSALATYDLLLLNTLRTSDTYNPSVGATAAPLEGACATWVIDVETKASVQYDKFNFNSYAKRGTEYLAAAGDGIYLLEGDTDEGADISALVDLAVSRFATPQRKYFPSVYLGVTSTGKLLLKAEVDGQTWLYEANNATTNIANQRIDLGRGLVGSHWHFTLLNQNGLDFELESVEFLPLISSRRVY